MGARVDARKVLIAGGLGMVGRSALTHFEALPEWEIIGLSRRRPEFETRASWVSVDLRDRQAVEDALSGLSGITHVVYGAVWEKPDIARGWIEAEHAASNLEMLRNLVEAVERNSSGLRHVGVVHGTKAYGAHLGPFRMPARETDPRSMPPNFYYDQEDWLRGRQVGKDWTWTILRPQIVCGIALGSPLNIVNAIGVFAAISRECGIPLRFPGGPEKVGEATDARLIAKALEWAATSEAAANQAFNVANGDVYIWQNLWPRIADLFGMAHAGPQPFSLARVMPENEAIWNQIVDRYKLQPNSYKDMVPAWQYADYLFGFGQRPNPHHVSTIKIRKAGFHHCQDTEEMFLDLLRTLQNGNILPR